MKMKKRFIALSLVVTMIIGVLSGCGNSKGGSSEGGSSKKSDTMTVSEMLEAVLEDNDGELYIYEADMFYDSDIPLGKNRPVHVYVYDGEGIDWCREAGRTQTGRGSYKLGDIANKEISFEKGGDKAESHLNLETDESGNNVYIEAMMYKKALKGRDAFYLGGFSRIEVYGTTFMCFATTVTHKAYYDNRSSVLYYLIEDTESTKDKTIVWDDLGTDGIPVDELNVDTSIYAPYIVKPAD